MPPESILFAILLILVVGLTLAFLLVKKPQFEFLGKSFRTAKAKRKSADDKAAGKKPTPVPNLNARAKEPIRESAAFHEHNAQVKESEPPFIASLPPPVGPTEGTDDSSVLLQSLQTAEAPFISEVAESIPKEDKSTQFGQLHGAPPNCNHFFGYLRKMPKDATFPDGCLGCLKMVECLYYSSSSE